MKKLLISLFAISSAITSSAYEFSCENGDQTLYFHITSDNDCEITYGEEPYSGDIVIPEHVTFNDVTYTVSAVGKEAFRNCRNLTSVEIPNSVITIKDLAFKNCERLTSIIIPDDVEYLGCYAFGSCINIKSMDIPNSVKRIDEYAFSYCLSLENVTISESVNCIQDWTFFNCRKLKSVTVYQKDPSNIYMGAGVFGDVPTADATLYVPKGSKELYQQSPKWNIFKIVEIGEDDDGVPTVEVDSASSTIYFDLSGRQISKPDSGIAITRSANGQAHKIRF